jgi:pimeloyl-ACP methyl ester carboxylesterase
MADVDVNGIRLHVQRLGNGGRETVVFLHGLVMDNLSSWYFTVANTVALTADVVLFDLRGHGKSHRPASGYTVADFVADIDGLIAALAIGRPVHLVGNSFGGLLAVSFAVARPDRVKSMVLIDSHYATPEWQQAMTGSLSLQGEELYRKIAVSFRHWLGRNSERKRSRLTDTAKEIVYGTTLLHDLNASATVSDEMLARIGCPVLGLYGEHSDVRAMGEHLARHMPKFELRLFSECTHSVLWEKTDTVRDDIAAWIAAH